MAGMAVQDAIRQRRSCRSFDDRVVQLAQVEAVLWSGMGMTNETGHRTVPSAHALYPLRYYLAVRNVEDCTPGVYCIEAGKLGDRLCDDASVGLRLADAVLEEQPWVGEAAFVIAVCAEFQLAIDAFADQPPVGERGSRYVYLEAGAAMQSMQLGAVDQGLGSVPVAGFDDQKVASVLGLPERLSAVVLLCAGWPSR